MDEVQALASTCYEVILEYTFDQLVKEIGCHELMNIGSREENCDGSFLCVRVVKSPIIYIGAPSWTRISQEASYLLPVQTTFQ
jgi:hypothetical protein